MKRQKEKKELSLPSSLPKEVLFLLIPAVLWLAGTFGRPYVLTNRCAHSPDQCPKEALLTVDQLSLGMENETADYYSFAGQNLSGIVALTLPHLWSAARLATGVLVPSTAISYIGIDTLLVLQAACWNGMFTEISHYLVQRPRPFVYSDPKIRGTDPSHYTSFYSGHTSFAAVANLSVFLILLYRGAPWYVLLFSAASSEILIFSTAYFRILAGRHFLTDVLAGMIAGTVIAVWIVTRFRKKAMPSATIPRTWL